MPFRVRERRLSPPTSRARQSTDVERQFLSLFDADCVEVGADDFASFLEIESWGSRFGSWLNGPCPGYSAGWGAGEAASIGIFRGRRICMVLTTLREMNEGSGGPFA